MVSMTLTEVIVYSYRLGIVSEHGFCFRSIIYSMFDPPQILLQVRLLAKPPAKALGIERPHFRSRVEDFPSHQDRRSSTLVANRKTRIVLSATSTRESRWKYRI